MKTRQQSLHDEAGSREPGKKATPRNWTTFGWRTVLISWHSLTNSATALGSSGELSSPSCRKAKSVLAAAPTGKDHLVNPTVRPTTDSGASELDVGENERPQLGMVAEKIFLHLARCLGLSECPFTLEEYISECSSMNHSCVYM